jgi:gamma-butyrobetaine dioxygenase
MRLSANASQCLKALRRDAHNASRRRPFSTRPSYQTRAAHSKVQTSHPNTPNIAPRSDLNKDVGKNIRVSETKEKGYAGKQNDYFKNTSQPGAWEIDTNHTEAAVSDRQKGYIKLKHAELKQPMILNKSWLRDSCSCDHCVDPSSGQKRFASSDIPDDLPIHSAQRCEDGSLEVSWQHDFLTGGTHLSQFPADQIESYFGGQKSDVGLPIKVVLWNKVILESASPFYDYHDWVKGGSDYLAGMASLKQYGIAFLRNVPKSETAVEDIQKKIGTLQETFYGKTWDVISKVGAENVAYTNSYLGLHQDMLYLDNPPRIQILHCLENSCEGGESFFSDGLRASAQMKAKYDPDQIRTLTKPITYHYRKGEHHYWQSRPILQPNHIGELPYWSPPFQRPEQNLRMDTIGHRDFNLWKRFVRAFKHQLEAEEYVYEYKMKPGDCVIFDNLRVLHGRRQFDMTSGSRWLKGAYVEGDSFKSTLLSLSERLPPSDAPLIYSQAQVFNNREKPHEHDNGASEAALDGTATS